MGFNIERKKATLTTSLQCYQLLYSKVDVLSIFQNTGCLFLKVNSKRQIIWCFREKLGSSENKSDDHTVETQNFGENENQDHSDEHARLL